MLSNVDILNAIAQREMIITPFTDDPTNPDTRLTPSGFNFSFTRFIVSINDSTFCQINEREAPDKRYTELYFSLGSGDTALALTKESIWVSNKLAGTFHSDVEIEIGRRKKGDEDQNINYKTFITLCLHRLDTPASIRACP